MIDLIEAKELDTIESDKAIQDDILVLKSNELIHFDERLNYKFSLSDEIGAGDQKAKYKANIEAIKLLKVIEKRK
ncbi:MAG: hypothetical protein ACYDG2_24675 [Ruminiclostridium sp.]